MEDWIKAFFMNGTVLKKNYIQVLYLNLFNFVWYARKNNFEQICFKCVNNLAYKLAIYAKT